MNNDPAAITVDLVAIQFKEAILAIGKIIPTSNNYRPHLLEGQIRVPGIKWNHGHDILPLMLGLKSCQMANSDAEA